MNHRRNGAIPCLDFVKEIIPLAWFRILAAFFSIMLLNNKTCVLVCEHWKKKKKKTESQKHKTCQISSFHLYLTCYPLWQGQQHLLAALSTSWMLQSNYDFIHIVRMFICNELTAMENTTNTKKASQVMAKTLWNLSEVTERVEQPLWQDCNWLNLQNDKPAILLRCYLYLNTGHVETIHTDIINS